MQDMAGMNMLCSDKTGTLTQNKMLIQADAPAFQEGIDLKIECIYLVLILKI
jgi:H+-transporting ATPase